MKIPIPFFGWLVITGDDDMTTFTTEDRMMAEIDYDYAGPLLRLNALIKTYHQLMTKKEFQKAFEVSCVIKDTAEEVEAVTQNFVNNPYGF
jgi:hypothetical protein